MSKYKINPINPNTEFKVNSGNTNFTNILNVLNVLGHINEAYTKTLVYKVETKRLELELERVREEVELAHKLIDRTFELKMEELKQRRANLIAFYSTVNQQLQTLHIERLQLLEMLELVVQKATDHRIPLEERLYLKDMVQIMCSQIPNFGQQASTTLDVLAKAIPAVAIPDKFE